MKYILSELRLFFLHPKNLIIFGLLLIVSIYYAIYITPSFKSIEHFNEAPIEARYEDRKDFLDNITITDNTHATTMFAYQVFPEWNEYDRQRLDAIQNGNLRDYAKATSDWYRYSDDIIYQANVDYLRYTPGYYTYGNRFSHYDGHYAFNKYSVMYDAYAEGNYDLTIDIFNEKTALQTLVRLMNSYFPYILLIYCLLLANDIVTKDRHHISIVRGYPITNFGKLMMKGIVAFLGTLSSFLIFLPAFIIISIQYGIGSLYMPVVHYDFAFLNLGDYTYMPVWQFLLQSFGLSILWIIALILLILILSVIFRSEFLNFTIIILFFIERIYYQRGTIIEDWLAWLPTSYVQFGNVTTGYLNYEMISGSILYQKGILVSVITILTLIFLLWVTSKIKKV